MTDAQILQSLLDMEHTMIIHEDTGYLSSLRAVIAELRRRIDMEKPKWWSR
jgi:hypothetical protein